MAQEQYEVEAHLRLITGGAENAMSRLGTRLQQIGQSISGASSGAAGMVRSMIGLGAAYVSVNAIVGGIERATSAAVQYQTAMEGMRIQTAAVMSAVDQIPFEQARVQAGQLFEQYRSDAIASVATTQDLVMISNAIMGPLRGAGQSMAQVRDITNQTVTASTALGVDLAQASRDMQLMVNGSAGMHVRLFQMLHATGAIAEDAQAFNALSAPERIARITGALGRFEGAASAYGRSFAGVTSTFQDIVDNLTATFFGPVFSRLTSFLGGVNDQLIGNRAALESVLTHAGEWIGDKIGAAFDLVTQGMAYVRDNWDEIVAKGESFLRLVQRLVPMIENAAAAWAALSLTRSIMGGGLSMAGGAMSLAGGMGFMPAGGGILGALMGGGGAAAGGAEMVGVGAALAPLTAAMTALAPIAAPIAAAFALVASVGMVISENWSDFVGMFDEFSPQLEAIGSLVQAIGSDLWDLVQPLLEILGDVGLAGGVPMLELFLTTLRGILEVVHEVTSVLSHLGGLIRSNLSQPLTESLIPVLHDISSTFGNLFGSGSHGTTSGPTMVEITNMEELAAYIGDGVREAWTVEHELNGGGRPDDWQHFSAYSGTPAARAHTINDFRGSRISVQQEFREADPDRVLVQMMDDVARQAESQLGSGYAPPFSR